MSNDVKETKKDKKQKEEVDFSQMTEEEIQEYKREKHKTWWQALKYALCTASAGLLEFITFSILTAAMASVGGTVHFIDELPINSFVPTFIALLLSIMWNFTINRKVTFKSAGNVPRAMFLAFLFYVPFFPFKLWFNGHVPQYLYGALGVDGATFLIEACSMLLNGILEFCWQKFFIYRNEEDTALAKYDVGTIGPNGEITPPEQEFTGAEIAAMLSAGLDIENMTDKDMHKWLKKNF